MVAQLLPAIFFLPEFRYTRPMSAFMTRSHVHAKPMKLEEDLRHANIQLVSIHDKPPLDTVNYLPRTIWSDMRLFSEKPDWAETWKTIYVRPPLLLPLSGGASLTLYPRAWAKCSSSPAYSGPSP